jgi:hypothetical protein
MEMVDGMKVEYQNLRPSSTYKALKAISAAVQMSMIIATDYVLPAGAFRPDSRAPDADAPRSARAHMQTHLAIWSAAHDSRVLHIAIQ